MLKFLQNKSANKLPAKPLLRYQPEMVYGHTQDSPQQFLGRHTIYFRRESNNEGDGRFSNLTSNHFKKKTEFLQNYQTFSIASQHRKTASRKSPRKKEVFQADQTDFNITKGQFSGFLDHHKHYGSIGTIHKQNKVSGSLLNKISWNKSNNATQKTVNQDSLSSLKKSIVSDSLTPSQSLNSKTNSSLWGRSNSISVFEKVARKSELKIRREEFLDNIKKEVKEKLQKKYSNFGLPRIGVQHQLFIAQKQKIVERPHLSEMEELNKNLQKFQQSLNYKFK